MTGTLRGARPALEKAKPATGLTDGLLPVWMQHRVYGKKFVNNIPKDATQTLVNT